MVPYKMKELYGTQQLPVFDKVTSKIIEWISKENFFLVTSEKESSTSDHMIIDVIVGDKLAVGYLSVSSITHKHGFCKVTESSAIDSGNDDNNDSILFDPTNRSAI